MEERSLQERLCLKFCRYYKPSKDESLACMGYRVIEGLSERGRKISFPADVEDPGDSGRNLLLRCMCRRCPFYEDGCDFVQGTPDASPCGGFVLIGHMFKTRALSVDDIEDIIELME